MELIVVLVWCACAFFSYKIAESKGRDPIGFAVLGFFLGLIGVIITACVPAVKPSTTVEPAE